MPRPRLGIIVRCMLLPGLVFGAGAATLTAFGEEVLLDDRVVPVQFQLPKKAEKTETPARHGDDDDPSTYQGLNILQAGSSNAALRKQSASELPLETLSVEAQQKTRAVLKGMSLYRRLPTISFEVDRNVYAYFLKNPDVAVASWRAMGISKFELAADTPQCYHADAGDGSKGQIEIFYSTPEDTLIYCEGAFKSPLLTKPIIARSVMRLQAKFETDDDGRLLATHHGDVYVEFPSQTVETIARIISPISHSIADRNFKQLTFYAHMMTVAMERQPGWVDAVARRMVDISPQQRDEFLRLSAASYVAAKKREAVRTGQPLTVEEVLRPLRLIPEPTTPVRPVSSGMMPASRTVLVPSAPR